MPCFYNRVARLLMLHPRLDLACLRVVAQWPGAKGEGGVSTGEEKRAFQMGALPATHTESQRATATPRESNEELRARIDGLEAGLMHAKTQTQGFLVRFCLESVLRFGAVFILLVFTYEGLLGPGLDRATLLAVKITGRTEGRTKGPSYILVAIEAKAS
ncbi:hypothetical protein K488DRAFT_74385 [Vararia minispora EC-137]|uniref:Uncharacterized protein n=1 Tax=Vararia minispora EC-137 TaxID=1314806 RepID=A0ACB8Q7F0_9AGAM|nr:hypothetical protein K488DRAFT_74385 [Vararia minispora EC-137]